MRAWVLVSVVAFACSDDDGSSLPIPDGAVQCIADEDCDDGNFCNGAERCAPGADANAVGCVPGNNPCFDGQTCNATELRCVTDCAEVRDADGDGADSMDCGGNDCDDSDPRRYPGNVEVCDIAGRDEDCDASTVGDRDADGDGAIDSACCNGERCGEDCNDEDVTAHPGGTELCDTRDNDCDGSIDEDVVRELYPDVDGDLFGDEMSEPTMGCAAGPGFANIGGDCDDTNPARNPGATEACDQIDNDCDESVDEGVAMSYWPDVDRDLFGDASAEAVRACAPPAGHVPNAFDCDDSSAQISPAAAPICDGQDTTCSGRADVGCRVVAGPDAVDSQHIGTTPSPTSSPTSCPDGEVLIGIEGKGGVGCADVGNTIQRFRGLCGRIDVETLMDSVNVNASATTAYAGTCNMPSDPSFMHTCPPGQVMVGFEGTDGLPANLIYDLDLICAPVEIMGSPGSTTVAVGTSSLRTGFSGATGGGTPTSVSFECPPNTVLASFLERSSGFVRGLELRCHELLIE